LRAVYFVYAALVAFSRPYVGVHYPSDIVFGALVGVILAWLYIRFLLRRYSWFALQAYRESDER
jgi:undecaprenyl-diphosphatase